MIMARNEDGTYSQVGFVKDNDGIDTEYIYDKDGDIVFEKGFTRETSGTVPLTINGIGKDLKDWSITGNTVQNGTPTPENPVEVQGVGDYDSETGMYKIPVVTSADGTEPITTPIYLDSPLYKIGNYADRLSKTEEVRVVKEFVLTGKENIDYNKLSGNSRFTVKNAFQTADYHIGFCSHYKYEFVNANNTVYHTSNNTSSVIFIFDNNYTSAADFKSYLAAQYAAGTPVTVWHVLAKPTTETFTAPQIPTINGTTVIDVDMAVKPESIYIEYK